MAVTMDSYAPYDSGAGANVTENTWRAFMRRAILTGVKQDVLNGMLVYGDSSGMQCKVSTGEIWIEGQWGQISAIKVLPIASNSSGNPRLDRVVARNDFINNLMVVDVLTGTPGATPVLPALTQNTSIWESHLGQVSVASGAATITAGNVTTLPVYGGAYQPYFSHVKLTTASTPIGAGTEQIAENDWVADDDQDGLYTPVAANTGSYFTIPHYGRWDIDLHGVFASVGSSMLIASKVFRNLPGTPDNNYCIVTDMRPANQGLGTRLAVKQSVVLNAGDTIKFSHFSQGAINLVNNINYLGNSEISIRYMGPR